MNRLILIIITLAALLAAGCADSHSDRVTVAADALAVGDTERARQECDALLADSTAFNTLSVNQLCRMAEVLIAIPDNQEANDGAAVRCLSRARVLNSDSVDAFLDTLRADTRHLYTLDRVGSMLTIPRDELVVEEEDMVPDSINTHHDD